MQSSSPNGSQHTGIPGNEQADQLAKCGAQEEQPSTSIHYQEKTTIIKTAMKPRQEKDAYHLLDIPGQVVLARLRSGHYRLNAHIHRKLKSFLPQRVPVVRRTRQPSMFFRDVTDTNQSELHSGHQQLRFTRNYMGAWRTWRRPPTCWTGRVGEREEEDNDDDDDDSDDNDDGDDDDSADNDDNDDICNYNDDNSDDDNGGDNDDTNDIWKYNDDNIEDDDGADNDDDDDGDDNDDDE